MNSTTTTLTYKGPIDFTFEGKKLTATVDAVAYYYYQPCVMYFKDGSGQPEYSELEVDEVKILRVVDEDKNEVPYVDDMEECIYDELQDFDDWVYPPDPEEMYDPYDREEE